MRCIIYVFILWLALAIGTPVALGQEPQKTGPKLKLESPVHDFGKLNSGDSVSHTFWFTNTGDQLLIITNVQPSCGCTAAADWSRQVEPGQAGRIPIQFNSANFSGPLTKLVTVVCNDPTQPAAYLQIKANVWKPVEVLPSYAVITVPPDSTSASTSVRIVNNQEEPLYLQAPRLDNTNFTFEIRTNMPGKEYQLVVFAMESVRSGNAQAQIQIPTSSTNIPPLAVTVYANVQSSLSVLPGQINIPSGPLPYRMTPVVTVINNTTNPLALTEPTVTVPGVELQFREVQPGKYFTMALAFPQGFEMTNTGPAELKVKSNNLKHPEIRVPIVQVPTPAVAPQAAAPGARVPPLSVAPRRVLTRNATQPTGPPAAPAPATAR